MQVIGTRSMILPEGTEIRTLGQLPDGSLTVITVKLERDLLVQTNGERYAVSSVRPPLVNKDKLIGFLLAAIILMVIAWPK